MMLVSAIVLACTKKNTVRISVKDAVTGKPIPGASIYISEIFNVSDGVSGSKTEKFYSGNTNSEGLLYVPKRFNNHRTYNIFASLDTANVCWQNSYGYLGTKDNFKKGFDFEFASCAYLRLSMHNVNCQGATDKITIDMQPSYIDNYDNFQPLTENGCYQNDFIESKVPSGNWDANWQVTRNGIVSNHDTTFFIPENGHYHLTINY